MKIRPHHIGIIVKDLEKKIDFYSNYFGCERISKIFEGESPDESTYGLKFTFLRATATRWLIELLEPTKEGAWMELLRQKGEGSMLELCFCVENIEEFYDKMAKDGIILEDDEGKPLTDPKYVPSPSGNKFAYLPMDVSGGTWIEILEESGTKYIKD